MCSLDDAATVAATMREGRARFRRCEDVDPAAGRFLGLMWILDRDQSLSQADLQVATDSGPDQVGA